LHHLVTASAFQYNRVVIVVHDDGVRKENIKHGLDSATSESDSNKQEDSAPLKKVKGQSEKCGEIRLNRTSTSAV